MVVSPNITRVVTNTSGTVALASTSTSLGVTTVVNNAPVETAASIEFAQQVVSIADIIGICSVSILALSFIYNMCANSKKNKINKERILLDTKLYILRREELEFEKSKYKEEHK